MNKKHGHLVVFVSLVKLVSQPLHAHNEKIIHYIILVIVKKIKTCSMNSVRIFAL